MIQWNYEMARRRGLGGKIWVVYKGKELIWKTNSRETELVIVPDDPLAAATVTLHDRMARCFADPGSFEN